MDDYFLVRFAREIGKTTSQLTLGDMLKFNKRKFLEPSKGEVQIEKSSPAPGPGCKFTRTKL